jgi:hypothetical protein
MKTGPERSACQAALRGVLFSRKPDFTGSRHEAGSRAARNGRLGLHNESRVEHQRRGRYVSAWFGHEIEDCVAPLFRHVTLEGQWCAVMVKSLARITADSPYTNAR